MLDYFIKIHYFKLLLKLHFMKGFERKSRMINIAGDNIDEDMITKTILRQYKAT